MTFHRQGVNRHGEDWEITIEYPIRQYFAIRRWYREFRSSLDTASGAAIRKAFEREAEHNSRIVIETRQPS